MDKLRNIMRLTLCQNIRSIILNPKGKVKTVVNTTVIETYSQIGKYIVREEQQGKERADYGKALIEDLAEKLTEEFGSSYDKTHLWNIKKFYLAFPILDALRQELSWTHYRLLLKVENEKARAFYINETITNGWSRQALNRQINFSYYKKRLLSSNERKAIASEIKEKTKDLQPDGVLKDPYVLEFLQLKDNNCYLESELEKALINKLNAFLLELGKGFAFVAQQKRISTET